MNERIQQLGTLIDGYKLSCYTEGKSNKTIEWYFCFLTKFRQFLEVNELPEDINRIDSQCIRGFIRYLQTEARVPRKGTNLSPTTIQGYVRTLKAFFSWLEREEYIQMNPMNNIADKTRKTI